jgi:hypothetical protein
MECRHRNLPIFRSPQNVPGWWEKTYQGYRGLDDPTIYLEAFRAFEGRALSILLLGGIYARGRQPRSEAQSVFMYISVPCVSYFMQGGVPNEVESA